ncbi:MAG TPA: hypothetical protein VIJ12_08220 [Candidatus Baltobacteraceae bacterium]
MTTTGSIAQAQDIVSEATEIALGRGWYRPEVFAGTLFRWVNNEAQIDVATAHPVRYKLVLSLEPGPGVGLKPFDLDVLVDGSLLTTLKVRGKESLTVELPPSAPRVHRVTLRANGGGKTTPNDARIMNFRVFDIAVQRGARDVLPAHHRIGSGWYPLESAAGKSFRWVNNDAEISVSNPAGTERLTFDVEPGPGMAYKPFKLQVRGEDGKAISEIDVKGLHSVDVPLPKGDLVVVKLHVDSQGTKIASDPRILNFRVLSTGS